MNGFPRKVSTLSTLQVESGLEWHQEPVFEGCAVPGPLACTTSCTCFRSLGPFFLSLKLSPTMFQTPPKCCLFPLFPYGAKCGSPGCSDLCIYITSVILQQHCKVGLGYNHPVADRLQGLVAGRSQLRLRTAEPGPPGRITTTSPGQKVALLCRSSSSFNVRGQPTSLARCPHISYGRA